MNIKRPRSASNGMKLSKTLVGIALMATMLAPAISSAQSTADLQAQIQALLVQVKVLQAQLAQQQGEVKPAFCHSFNKNFGVGNQDDEATNLVQALVKEGLLNSDEMFQDAITIHWRPILSYDEYNERVAFAVTGFQEKYKSEILTPGGLSNGTGYVGVLTRKKLNSLYGCEGGIILPPPKMMPVFIFSLTPSSGPAGTVVTMKGYGFGVGSATVKFGDISISGLVPANDNTLVFTVPRSVALCDPSATMCPAVVSQRAYYVSMTGDKGASSDRMVFTVTPGTNSSPAISGVSGPVALKVSQYGTWTVTASDPNNGVLNYSVIWGDETIEVCVSGGPCATSAVQIQQSATFTHSYGAPGTYNPKFTVTNASGLSAQTSLSVNVGDVFPVARIISLNPVFGPVETQVTITGSGFTPTSNRVKFGNLGSENNPVYNLKSADGHTLTFNVPSSNYFACWSTAPDPCSAPAIATAPGVYGVSVITAYDTSNEVSFTVTSSTSVAPVISYLFPNFGLVGAQATIAGTGFTSTGNTLHFGSGMVPNLSSSDGRTITFSVPGALNLPCRFATPHPCSIVSLLTQPGTYPVSITNANGTSNAMNYMVVSPTSTAPFLASMNPVAGPVSAQVTLIGTGFSSTGNTVNFGNGAIPNLSSSNNQIIFNVPSFINLPCRFTTPACAVVSLPTQPGVYPVTVTNERGTSNYFNYTVTSGASVTATITAINPTSGLVGASVVITGHNFTATGNRVNFGNGVIMDLVPAGSSATDVQTLTFTVPSTLDLLCRHQAPYCAMLAGPTTPGIYPVSVTNTNGTSNMMNFTVTTRAPIITTPTATNPLQNDPASQLASMSAILQAMLNSLR